jgi:hypothetical protein
LDIMSAYIVDREHILYLVSSAMSGSIVRHRGAFHWFHGDKWHNLHNTDYEKAADVANMLWRENIASVSARYPNESSATLPGPVGESFTITPNDISTWEVERSKAVY